MQRTRRVAAILLLLGLLGCRQSGREEPLTTSMPKQTVEWAEKLTHENLAILTALPSALFGPYAATYLIHASNFLYNGARSAVDAQVTLLYGEEQKQQEATITLLQDLGSALEVNIQDLLNRSPEREQTLNAYLTGVQRLLVAAKNQKEALTSQRDAISSERSDKRRKSADIQHDLSQALRQKNYSVAGTKQQDLTEVDRQIADLDVRLKNLQSMIDIFKDLQEVGERRLIAIDKNRAALIAGVEVVEVPGIEDIGVFRSTRYQGRNSDLESIYNVGPIGQ